MFNPNSQNLRWSKWVWFVAPSRQIVRSFAEVQANCARFGAKFFGHASQMRVRQTTRGYIIEVLTEGHPVHDKTYTQYVSDVWQKFFDFGFGLGTNVKMSAKLMAGSRQDGTPAEQLLIMPSINLLGEVISHG